MRSCRFGEGRLGVVEGSTVKRCHRGARRAARIPYPLPRTTCSSRTSTRLRRARVRSSPTVARRCPSSACAAQPGGEPGQDRRGAGELPEAPRRGARQPAAARQQSRDTRSRSRTPGLFLKATSSLVGPGQGIVVRCADRRTDHEVELAFVIGRTASRVSRGRGAGLRRRLLDRSRHHDPRLRGPQLPQVAGHLQRARPVAGDRRRDSRSRRRSTCRSPSTASCARSRTRDT